MKFSIHSYYVFSLQHLPYIRIWQERETGYAVLERTGICQRQGQNEEKIIITIVIEVLRSVFIIEFKQQLAIVLLVIVAIVLQVLVWISNHIDFSFLHLIPIEYACLRAFTTFILFTMLHIAIHVHFVHHAFLVHVA